MLSHDLFLSSFYPHKHKYIHDSLMMLFQNKQHKGMQIKDYVALTIEYKCAWIRGPAKSESAYDHVG